MSNYIRKISQLDIEDSLRIDNTFQAHLYSDQYVFFYDLFDIDSGSSVDVGSIENEIDYVEIGNINSNGFVSPRRVVFDEEDPSTVDIKKKIYKGDIQKVSDGMILIPKVRPYLKKFVFIDDKNSCYYYTKALIAITPKINNELSFYLLKSILFDKINSISRRGKSYPTINSSDLSRMKIPKSVVNRYFNRDSDLALDVSSYHLENTSLIARSKSIPDIVDEVLEDKFGFDYATFDNLREVKKYKKHFSKLVDINIDLIISAKFHREAGDFVFHELTNISSKKIKDFADSSFPISLGKTITDSGFTKSGDKYYISMETIKNHKIEVTNKNLITESFYNDNQDKHIRKGDIVMARSGVSVGKCALVEDEAVKGVYADFTMRIRLKNYNTKFAYYYFRSNYFQYLIEIYKRGLQNKNIYPYIIGDFPIPDLDIEEQSYLVEEIDNRASQQEKWKASYEENENKIYERIYYKSEK